METISTRELTEIIDTMAVSTLLSYLSNYRFIKYRVSHQDGLNAKYLLCDDFLNCFYTLLSYRNRPVEMKKFKNHFKTHNVKVIDWEDFICRS